MDPDPRGKKINQKLKKKLFTPKPKSELFKKKRDYKNFLISEWFIKKISEKIQKI